jgi:biotin carboxylase
MRSSRLRFMTLLKPYQQLLAQYSDGHVPAHWFIAEAPLVGEQVTVDGFVQESRITVQGVVDSVMYPGTRSFRRFNYPSRLPAAVQVRLAELTTRLVAASGLDHTCFNVELFYDPANDAIHVIELNPRMSYQFSGLYEMVDGTSTHAVQLDLATGRRVDWRPHGGQYGAASSFTMRRFSDARVTRVPGDREIAALRERFSGATVKVLFVVGERLSHHEQDVGSFRYAIVNLGGVDAAIWTCTGTRHRHSCRSSSPGDHGTSPRHPGRYDRHGAHA